LGNLRHSAKPLTFIIYARELQEKQLSFRRCYGHCGKEGHNTGTCYYLMVKKPRFYKLSKDIWCYTTNTETKANKQSPPQRNTSNIKIFLLWEFSLRLPFFSCFCTSIFILNLSIDCLLDHCLHLSHAAGMGIVSHSASDIIVYPPPNFLGPLYNSSAFIPLPPESFPAPGHGGSKPDIPRICYPADWAVDRSALHGAVRAFLKAAEYSLSASPAFLTWRPRLESPITFPANPLGRRRSKSVSRLTSET
jgi:hypothetical protein